MNYICEICNVIYNSRMGYYKHNKKHHMEKHIVKNNNYCKYCEKLLSNYKSKWRHEKTCKINNKQIIQMQNEINLLKTELNNFKQKQNCVNNIYNTHNIFYIFPVGQEETDVLSSDFIENSLDNNGVNAIIDIIKKKHFNPELPQCHNFCVTAKNDTFAQIIDPETKKIKAVNKKDVFDMVYSNAVTNVNSIKKPSNKIKETTEFKKISSYFISNMEMMTPLLKLMKYQCQRKCLKNYILVLTKKLIIIEIW